MRFTSGVKASDVHVELKYCERCGGLFLREPDAGSTFCGKCAQHLADPMASITRQAGQPSARQPRLVRGPKARVGRMHGSACFRSLPTAAAAGEATC